VTSRAGSASGERSNLDPVLFHLEPYIDAVVLELRTQLNPVIDGINADHPGDFQLDHIEDGGYIVGGTEQPATVWPFLEVAIPDWTWLNISLEVEHADTTFFLAVKVMSRDPVLESGRLYRRCLRYGQAVTTVMLSPTSVVIGGSRAVLAGARGAYRFNPEQNQAEHVVGGCLMVYEMHVEDYQH